MIHTYQLHGMHCASCVGRVQQALEAVPGVKKAIVSLSPPEAVVNMSSHIRTDVLNKAVTSAGAYSITEGAAVIDTMKPGATLPSVATSNVALDNGFAGAVAEPSVTTYRPLLLILAFLLGITALVEVRMGAFDAMRAMQTFMAGFFLTFSFFKLLDVTGFASSYRMYDVLAKAWPGWGYVYPFVELALGVAYLTGWNPFVTNSVTIVVMGISLIGVVQSVLSKQQIRCACLGAVFNLPMTTVTIVEDALMLGMAGWMLFLMR